MAIYVCGHRNPDTDSVVAAMAYAGLYTMLGEKDYVPVRLGPVNDETGFLLKRFGFQPPAMTVPPAWACPSPSATPGA